MEERSIKIKRENISTIFLLPTLQIKREVLKEFRKFGFVRSYIYCDQYDYCKCFKPMFLLFKPKSFDAEFYSFNVQLERNFNFVETVDLSENKVMIVFKVPKLFENDYELIERGKYSKTSFEYKRLFPMDSTSNFYHIFNKTEYLKKKYIEGLGIENTEHLPEEFYSKLKVSEETLYW